MQLVSNRTILNSFMNKIWNEGDFKIVETIVAA